MRQIVGVNYRGLARLKLQSALRGYSIHDQRTLRSETQQRDRLHTRSGELQGVSRNRCTPPAPWGCASISACAFNSENTVTQRITKYFGSMIECLNIEYNAE